MGQDRTVRYPTTETPAWEAIRAELVRVGSAPSIRTIDGLPAFPDEQPEPGWKELRLGLPAGMVTIRRGPGTLSCVIWGTGEPALQTAWAQVVWACAAAGSGRIETPAGSQSPGEFAAANGITWAI